MSEKYQIDLANLAAQEAAAAKWLKANHQKLLEAGFVWDGLDGYAAPEGMEPEVLMKLITSSFGPILEVTRTSPARSPNEDTT